MAELRPKLSQVPGVRVYMVNQPPINLGGQQGARSLYQFTLQDTDTAELYQWAPMLEAKVRELPGHRGRQQRPADQEPADPGRPRSRQDLGARPERQPGRDRALQRLRHAAGVADLRAEQPVPGDPAGRAGVPEGSGRAVEAVRALDAVPTGATQGPLIPLSTVAKVRTEAGPLTVSHTGQLPSVTISFNLKPGYALGDAVDRRSRPPPRRRCRRRSRPASRAPRRRSRTRCAASA